MTCYWTTVAILLSTLTLAVGCGDRNRDTPNISEQNPPAAQDQVSRPPVDQAAPPPVDQAAPASPNEYASSPESGSAARRERAPRDTTARSATAASPAAPRVEWREVTIPAGTSLPLELTTALSSETATVEAPVQARLRQAVVVNGHTALPAGSVLTGTVTDVERSGRVQGRARLAFRFNEVRLDTGREDLRTNPLTFEAEATKGEDATKIGAGAVGGAIIGGIVGGGKGAAKGAAIGGAAGTGVVMATRGKEVTLASGTDLAATLASPLVVRAQER